MVHVERAHHPVQVTLNGRVKDLGKNVVYAVGKDGRPREQLERASGRLLKLFFVHTDASWCGADDEARGSTCTSTSASAASTPGGGGALGRSPHASRTKVADGKADERAVVVKARQHILPMGLQAVAVVAHRRHHRVQK